MGKIILLISHHRQEIRRETPHLGGVGVLGEAEVRLDLTDLTELGLGIGGRDGGRNDNVITGDPVDGGGDTVLLGGQKSIDDTEDLGGVTASGGGVGEGETDLLGGVDDEDGADGQSQTLGIDVGGVLVVDHVVQVGDLALGVGNDGELQLGARDLIDVLDPAVVGLDVVGAQTDELDTASSELGLELGEGTELGGADGGEVIGVGEEDGPLVTDEVVEVDGTGGGLGIEVRGSRAQTETGNGSIGQLLAGEREKGCSIDRGVTYGARSAAIVKDVEGVGDGRIDQ